MILNNKRLKHQLQSTVDDILLYIFIVFGLLAQEIPAQNYTGNKGGGTLVNNRPVTYTGF